ncbi:MAG: hypothetical protein HY342_08220 [Candidatus Lambdaproteobacteria bacterium]|nr:hypothetical protein [Candidatus Lambdaproteobacteria bacterium]
MKRLQHIILALWAVLLVLFFAFNWSYVWRPVQFNFLFMEFNLRIVFWIGLGSLVTALVLHLLSMLESGGLRRRMSQSMDQLSAQVHAARSRELEELLERVEHRFRSMLGKSPSEASKAEPSKGGKD